MKNFIGSAACYTVLVVINVTVGADLTSSVDTGESFEAAARVSANTEHFIGLSAAIDADSVIVHHESNITVAAIFSRTVGGANGASNTITIVKEERNRAEVADALIDTISNLTLAAASAGVDNLVDTTSGHTAVFSSNPELSSWATTAVISVIGIARKTHTLSSSITLTVKLAGLALDTNSVGHIVASRTNTATQTITVAVSRTSFLNTFIPLTFIASVTDAGITNFLTVVRASIRVDVKDAGAQRVARVASSTNAELTIVNFIISRTSGGLVAIEL